MTSLTWVVLIIGILAIAFAILAGLKVRSKKLRSKFGPEYDRLVRERGSTFTAERELEHREKRVQKFSIRPLSHDEGEHFAHQWRGTQEKFVDDPRAAVAEADRLVHDAMRTRGYPTGGEFNELAADLSVDHPRVVEHYRAAHDVAMRDERDAVSTEDLRVAMRHYRVLFEDLLGRHVDEVTGVRR
jgi:FtsZ-interacting cell division protein ZipA